MKRRLFSAASAFSLLLFVATAVMWVRSYWTMDFVAKAWVWSPSRSIRYVLAGSNRGIVGLDFMVETYTDSRELTRRAAQFPSHAQEWRRLPVERIVRGPGIWNAIGFGYEHVDDPTPQLLTRQWSLGIPDWLLALFFLATPLWKLKARVSDLRKYGRYHCPACAYNLTGNVSGVCPECGKTIELIGVVELKRL